MMAELNMRLLDDCAICRHSVKTHKEDSLIMPICTSNKYLPALCNCEGFTSVVTFRFGYPVATRWTEPSYHG